MNTTKQLTGTITLPGVDPDEFELTGEYRRPNKDEWFAGVYSEPARTPACDDGPRIILRRKPRKPRKIRVTPTQADLDAATEPIPCWMYEPLKGRWYEKKLYAIDKFNGWFYTGNNERWSKCEIEKEVTE